ncbi:TPA: DUF429 domain-containing protein [Candidatus Acetothermia bacterium]|nr:DUF429 domain-containing protein [Candidatus Acetothermia bacterium]
MPNMYDVRFVGLDLAWSPRNTSGAVVLDWDGAIARPVAWDDALTDDAAIVAFVARTTGAGPALVAVDAPLVVPNETGSRPCDRAVSSAYGHAEAGARPVSRRSVAHMREEKLVALLAELGFQHSPTVRRQVPVRQVVEVYPHPAMVELFGLTKTLKYKACPERPYPLRWAELGRLRDLLRSLSGYEPALEGGGLLDAADPHGRRGRTLKRLEDLLDACFCAYTALHIWYWGEMGYRLFGDLESGYILVPVRPADGP